MSAPEIDEEDMQMIYNWVDEIPLSWPKRNIGWDFADGVLIAEIIHYYFPKLVELHNYQSVSGKTKKTYNWTTLNQKVFKKMGLQISKEDITAIVMAEPEAIEWVLKVIKDRLVEIKSGSWKLTAAGPAALQPPK